MKGWAPRFALQREAKGNSEMAWQEIFEGKKG